MEMSISKSADARGRRRHTAPVKASTMLKRNQPNTVATGLKAPHTRLRGKYFRESALNLRKMDTQQKISSMFFSFVIEIAAFLFFERCA